MLDHFKFTALLALVTLQTGCGTLNGPLRGVVIDKSTGQPVEDTIVVAHWRGAVASPAHSQTLCYHVETATTDSDGQFRIPNHFGGPWYVTNRKSFVAGIYKEGYREVSHEDRKAAGFEPAPEGVEYLVPFDGSAKERITYLSYLISRSACSGADENRIDLFPVYKRIYEESKELAVTDEDKKWVERFRRSAANAALASEKKGDMTGREVDQMINEYLQDNLQ